MLNEFNLGAVKNFSARASIKTQTFTFTSFKSFSVS